MPAPTRLAALGVALAALALAGPAAAAPPPDDVAGAYAVEGSGARCGAYAGEATIEAAPDGAGLVLTLRRGGAPLLVRAALVLREDGALAAEAPLVAGVVGALDPDAPAGATVLVRYRRRPDGLSGRWRIVRDGAVLDSGRETLRRLGAPGEPAQPAEPGSSGPPAAGAVRVAVSVDWEGRDVTPDNVRAMVALRAALPDVPLTHFMNAAYFTKPGADAAALAARLREVLRPGDETGLHLHAWRTLFESAGVAFRRGPSFWGEGYPLQPAAGDLGHEVEIGAYTVAELRAVLSRSRAILAQAGVTVSGSFRAGGWMATPNVLEAIRAEGFLVDSSATDASWHDELGSYRLRTRIPEVWPGVTATSSPRWIETAAGPVLEMPDTGALADYVTADEMTAHLRQGLARLAADPARDVFLHVGFHQETAAQYARRVADAIRAVRQGAPGARLVFETLEASAARARAALGE